MNRNFSFLLYLSIQSETCKIHLLVTVYQFVYIFLKYNWQCQVAYVGMLHLPTSLKNSYGNNEEVSFHLQSH